MHVFYNVYRFTKTYRTGLQRNAGFGGKLGIFHSMLLSIQMFFIYGGRVFLQKSISISVRQMLTSHHKPLFVWQFANPYNGAQVLSLFSLCILHQNIFSVYQRFQLGKMRCVVLVVSRLIRPIGIAYDGSLVPLLIILRLMPMGLILIFHATIFNLVDTGTIFLLFTNICYQLLSLVGRHLQLFTPKAVKHVQVQLGGICLRIRLPRDPLQRFAVYIQLAIQIYSHVYIYIQLFMLFFIIVKTYKFLFRARIYENASIALLAGHSSNAIALTLHDGICFFFKKCLTNYITIFYQHTGDHSCICMGSPLLSGMSIIFTMGILVCLVDYRCGIFFTQVFSLGITCHFCYPHRSLFHKKFCANFSNGVFYICGKHLIRVGNVRVVLHHLHANVPCGLFSAFTFRLNRRKTKNIVCTMPRKMFY
ncbi:pNP419L [African swine fever virus]|uniref:PNP419L n=1 Tax=African swine fever virus TaxID=10497 RepID=A0A8A1V4Q1_ASF|nr:pNP419L [African swine fever virus]